METFRDPCSSSLLAVPRPESGEKRRSQQTPAPAQEGLPSHLLGSLGKTLPLPPSKHLRLPPAVPGLNASLTEEKLQEDQHRWNREARVPAVVQQVKGQASAAWIRSRAQELPCALGVAEKEKRKKEKKKEHNLRLKQYARRLCAT